jgi:hypothetical protein
VRVFPKKNIYRIIEKPLYQPEISPVEFKTACKTLWGCYAYALRKPPGGNGFRRGQGNRHHLCGWSFVPVMRSGTIYTSWGVSPPPVISSVFRSEKIEKISTHRGIVKSWLKSSIQDSRIMSTGAGRGGGPAARIILSEPGITGITPARPTPTGNPGLFPAGRVQTAVLNAAPFVGLETPPQSSNGTVAKARPINPKNKKTAFFDGRDGMLSAGVYCGKNPVTRFSLLLLKKR